MEAKATSLFYRICKSTLFKENVPKLYSVFGNHETFGWLLTIESTKNGFEAFIVSTIDNSFSTKVAAQQFVSHDENVVLDSIFHDVEENRFRRSHEVQLCLVGNHFKHSYFSKE